jgi:hypothetical protein
VPLNALLQQRSGDQEKGRLMATNNVLNMLAILLSSGALASARRRELRHDAGSRGADLRDPDAGVQCLHPGARA